MKGVAVRAVRPFYIESDVEGRKTNLKGGPISKSGDMTTSVYQRDEGSITEPYTILCRHRFREGVHYLVTEIQYQGKKIHEHETKY